MTQGDARSAAKAFRAALENNKDMLLAYAELGKLALAEENWGKARKYFDKIVKRDPANIEARYNLGIRYRELGKSKSRFLQGLFFSRI